MAPEKIPEEKRPEEKRPEERIAEWAEADPFYMASALAAYRRSEGLDALALAEVLGCTPTDLTALALCRKPGAIGEEEFGADVAHLVHRFGLIRAALIRLLRQERFLQATGSPPPTVTFRTNVPAPMLLAAQDRPSEDDLHPSDADPDHAHLEGDDDGRLAG